MNLPDFTVPPKAVAIDLDGTLLNSRVMVSNRNRRAVERCLEAGIPVVIATSRALRMARRLLGDGLAPRCSLVLQNGAVSRAAPPFAGNDKVVLPERVARRAIETMRALEPDIVITVEIDGTELGSSLPPGHDPARLRERSAATPDMVLTLEEALRRQPSKLAAGGLGKTLVHVAEALQKELGDVLSVVPGDGLTFLNITMKEATKPEAIRRLVATAGLTLADVLAMGDDVPDLDMLRACGTAVAMGNACPEVLAATAYRTLSNDEDGVALVLEKLVACADL